MRKILNSKTFSSVLIIIVSIISINVLSNQPLQAKSKNSRNVTGPCEDACLASLQNCELYAQRDRDWCEAPPTNALSDCENDAQNTYDYHMDVLGWSSIPALAQICEQVKAEAFAQCEATYNEAISDCNETYELALNSCDNDYNSCMTDCQ